MSRIDFVNNNTRNKTAQETAYFGEAVDDICTTSTTKDIMCPNCKRPIRIACLSGGPFEGTYWEERAKMLEERLKHFLNHDEETTKIIYSLAVQGKWNR